MDTCAEGAYRFHWSVIASEASLPIAAGHNGALCPIRPDCAVLPATLPVEHRQWEAFIWKPSIFPAADDDLSEANPPRGEISNSRRGANNIVQPGQQHGMNGNLKTMLCNGPIELSRPRRVSHRPIHQLRPIAKVPALVDLTPIGLLGGREVVEKGTGTFARIKNKTSRLKVVNNPFGKVRVGIDYIIC